MSEDREDEDELCNVSVDLIFSHQIKLIIKSKSFHLEREFDL